RDGVVARQDYEVVRNRTGQCGHLADISRRLLDAYDAGNHGQPFHRRRLEVRAASARYVVENYGQSRRLCNGAIVLIETLLRRLVVVRSHGKQSVGAKQFNFASKFDHFLRVVASGASEDRDLPRTLLDGNFDDTKMLGARQGRAFSGGAARHEEIDAGGDLAP